MGYNVLWRPTEAMMRKRLKRTIGVSDFKDIIDINGYPVDKSLFIRDVWKDSWVVPMCSTASGCGSG